MDRYRLGALASLIRDARSDEQSVSAFFRASTRMMGNYMHVWLALLVGAVMLLDFGDAWVQLAENGDIGGIATTFGIGLGGTLVYLLADIVQKTHSPISYDSSLRKWSRYGRVTVFLGVCFTYTVLVTSGLWYMFSGTDLVLQGDGARLHVLVWTGFALFVGVFFGLLTDTG